MNPKDAERSLKLFFYGPSTGESIAIRLPDASWGLVDCYIPPKVHGTGVLEFFAEQQVEELAFFCITHPHADHYLGAEKIFQRYAGKIKQIWQWDGFSGREMQAKLIAAAEVKAIQHDPEARKLARGFLDVIMALDTARKEVAAYRRVAAPLTLLETPLYKISAIRPDNNLIADVEGKLQNMIVEDGNLVFDEEEGSLLNSLSIVLLLEFGAAKVLLLGDAEDPTHPLISDIPESCIKIAHHGSKGGLGVESFACPPREQCSIDCLVITPYVRSALPRADMIDHYRKVTSNLILTGSGGVRRPTFDPMTPKAKYANDEGTWYGVEVFETGELRRCSCAR